jgi:hypothetical protein
MRPDNDALVCSSSSELLSVLRVSDAVDSIFVTFDLLDHLARLAVIHEHSVSDGHKDFVSVWSEAHTPDLVGEV